VKFVIGVVVGWWVFHPYNENSKLDRASVKMVQKGGEKLTDFVLKQVDKVLK
jgi:hypothetical protein